VRCGMGKKTYDPLILELDCASIVASLAVQQEERYLNTYILKEIQACSFYSQSCCSREYNRVAYELAELAKRTVHCAVWRENAPSCVTDYSNLIVVPCVINIITLFSQKKKLHHTRGRTVGRAGPRRADVQGRAGAGGARGGSASILFLRCSCWWRGYDGLV
jgi:hypothetical protein